MAVVMKNWHPFVFGPEFACPHTVAVADAVSMEGNYDRDADGKGGGRGGWIGAYHGEEPGLDVLLLEVLVLSGGRRGLGEPVGG